MALINCDECNKEYSNKATACPDCGCPTTYFENNNTTKSIDKLEYNNKIYGNESLPSKKPSLNLLSAMILKLAVPIGFISLLSGYTDIFFISATISIVVLYLGQPSNKNIREYHRIKLINTYFKKCFPLLNDFKTEYENLGSVNYSGDSNESVMFKIYMDAYNKNADAIVLNSDKSSTDVVGNVSSGLGGTVSGSTSSHTTYHITATIVKFKNVTYNKIEYKNNTKCKKCDSPLSDDEVDKCSICKDKPTILIYLVSFIILFVLAYGLPNYGKYKKEKEKKEKIALKIEKLENKANKLNLNYDYCISRTGKGKIRCLTTELEYQRKLKYMITNNKTDNWRGICKRNPKSLFTKDDPKHWKYNKNCIYSVHNIERKVKQFSIRRNYDRLSNNEIQDLKRYSSYKNKSEYNRIAKIVHDISNKYGIYGI